MGDKKNLNIFSWNVQGLGHPIKRRKVLDFLKNKACDIALLQEMHLSDTESKKLKRDWLGEVVYAPEQASKAGVAVLFRRSLNLVIKRWEADVEGRWVEVLVDVDGFEFMLLDVYAPNQSTPALEGAD